MGLVESMLNLYQKVDIDELDEEDEELVEGETLDEGDSDGKQRDSLQQITTRTIAGKLNCKSGPDLVKAAAARLTYSLRLSTFKRKQILGEMKKASGYYKQSYGQNLSNYLNQLVKDGILVETSANTYALDAKTGKSLERQLAG